MTALIKKDLYLIGRSTWILLGVALICNLLPQFASFGSAYLMVLTLTLPLTTLAYDERCRWDMYLAMTPCPPAKAVLSKYLFTLLMAAAATSVTLLADLFRIITGSMDYDLTENLVQKAALLVMILTVNAITLPTIFRFGVEKGRLTMMALCFGTFAAIVGGAKLIGEDKMFRWMERVPLQILGAAAAAVIVAVNIASIFLSIRFYKKRQSGAYN